MGTRSNATPLDDQAVREICWMYKNGRKIRDILQAYHISACRLKKILKEQGIERETVGRAGRGRPSSKPPGEKPIENSNIPLDWCKDWDVARMILTGERKIPTRLRKRFCRKKIPGARILEWLEENQGYKWEAPVMKKE